MRIRTFVVVAMLAGALGAGAGVLSCDLRDAVTCDPDELNLETGFVGDFGANASAKKIEAFFQSTIALQTSGKSLANSLTTACTNIGLAVGVPATEMQPTATTPTDADRITAACDRVATEIRTIIGAAVPSGAVLAVDVTPADCSISVDAYAGCVGDCSVTIDPAEVQCEPGRAVGRCSGSCSGSCWVRASAACAGECSAQCTGTCTGTCYGGCTGTCTEVDGSGNCVGECTGTCTALCS